MGLWHSTGGAQINLQANSHPTSSTNPIIYSQLGYLYLIYSELTLLGGLVSAEEMLHPGYETMNEL